MFTSKWCGELQYNEALRLQQNSAQELSESESATGFVFGLEHRSVITLGRRVGPGNGVIVSAEELGRKGIEVVPTERGGLATLHSPGQLVIYPVLSLHRLNWTVRQYTRLALNCTQSIVSRLGIVCNVDDCQSGLFTAQGKLAFIGIRVRRGITMHGLSINVNNDLQLFENISVCGAGRRPLVSLSGLGLNIETKDLFALWVEEFNSLTQSVH